MPATVKGLDPTGTARALVLGTRPGGWFTPGHGDGARDDGELPVEELHLAWEAASWPSGMPPGDRRALALLLAAVGLAIDRGGTRLPLDVTGSRVLDALAMALGTSAEERAAAAVLLEQLAGGCIPDGLHEIIGRDHQRRPYVVTGGGLYQHRMLVLEREVAAALATRLAGPPPPIPDDAIERILDALPGRQRLAPEQLEAVRRALHQPLTAITGGPGTGKTSIVAGVVSALTLAGIPREAIALAAPTGKAAQRMAEALAQPGGPPAPPASTLHRLLGYDASAGRPQYDRHHPLPHAAVIVDESSMIDLALMQALLAALPPSARLVLLGDADQLPAVAPGDVFRVLAPTAVRLVHSYRLDARDEDGAQLLRSARAVAEGNPEAIELVEVERVSELRFRGLELLVLPDSPRAAAAARRTFLECWHERLLSDEARSQRLLCVTRGARLPTGAAAVNQELARLHAAAHGLPRSDGFVRGAPVIVERNDHGRGLWNGDTGEIAPADAVIFPRSGGSVTFPLAAIRSLLSPAWAITVHKAQGSEHDRVGVILPDHDLPLLGRQSLYTAMTRARRGVVIVGRRGMVERAIARPMTRFSGLAEELQRSRDELHRPGLAGCNVAQPGVTTR